MTNTRNATQKATLTSSVRLTIKARINPPRTLYQTSSPSTSTGTYITRTAKFAMFLLNLLQRPDRAANFPALS
jgi:hypothetical protein